MKTPPLNLASSFVAFTQCENIVQAAARHGLSQPALSVHLREFEKYFSQKVFEFRGRRKVLTAFGTRLKGIYEGRLENLAREIKSLDEQFQKESQARVVVGARTEILSDIFKSIKFDGELIFRDLSGPDAVSALRNHSIDIAIATSSSRTNDFVAKAFMKDQFKIIFPVKKVGAREFGEELLIQLAKLPMFAYREEDEILSLVFRDYPELELPRPQRVFSNWPALIELTRQNQGWLICPTRFKTSTPGFISVAVPNSIIPASQFFVLYRPESRKMKWFLDLVDQFVKAGSALTI